MRLGTGIIGGVEKFPEVMAGSVGNSTGSLNRNYAAPLPAGIVAGEMLVLIVSGPFDISASGWTKLFEVNHLDSGFAALACFYRVATGAEGPSVALTAVDPSIWASVAYRIKGAKAIEAAAGAGSAATVADPPPLSPSWGARKTLWIAAAATASPGSRSVTGAPSGYSSLAAATGSISTGSTVSIGAAWRQLEAATENPGTMAIHSTTVLNVANTIAIRPK